MSAAHGASGGVVVEGVVGAEVVDVAEVVVLDGTVVLVDGAAVVTGDVTVVAVTSAESPPEAQPAATTTASHRAISRR